LLHNAYSLVMTEKVQGPASYFPSIEKKYGQPISYWMDALGEVKDKPHMEQVTWLKTEHNMGHGHANAIVAVFRKDNNL
jgi:Domain of unknown function (DUF4287)